MRFKRSALRPASAGSTRSIAPMKTPSAVLACLRHRRSLEKELQPAASASPAPPDYPGAVMIAMGRMAEHNALETTRHDAFQHVAEIVLVHGNQRIDRLARLPVYPDISPAPEPGEPVAGGLRPRPPPCHLDADE